MSKQGRQNMDQGSKALGKQRGKTDIEFGDDFQVGNDSSQSQKKSGRQINKKSFYGSHGIMG